MLAAALDQRGIYTQSTAGSVVRTRGAETLENGNHLRAFRMKTTKPINRRKEGILVAAETLFAGSGYSAVSIRDIASLAEVNVASINYYFKSKAGLFESLFERRVVPVNAQRLEMLEAAKAKQSDGVPTIEDLVYSFMKPPLSLGEPEQHDGRGLIVMQFLARVLSMPNEHVYLETYYGEVRTQYIQTLMKVFPDLTTDTILRRYNLMVGALIYAMAGPTRMLRPPAGVFVGDTPEWTVEETVCEITDFCTGGFNARGHAHLRNP